MRSSRKFLQVCVTRQHIQAGCRHLSNLCALSLALQDKLQTTQVTVSTATGLALANPMTGPVRLRLSEPALRWATDFDAGEKVKPRTFRLEVLEER